MERPIAFLGKELARLEKQIALQIEASDIWTAQETLLRTAPGVGPKTSRCLLAELPELGHVGGRTAVRSMLYVASWTAVRVPGTLRDFYLRLVAAGKPKQVALIAAG